MTPLDREVRYSFSHSEKHGYGLAIEPQAFLKKSTLIKIEDRNRISGQINNLPLFKKSNEIANK
jgi:hypothetical protein